MRNLARCGAAAIAVLVAIVGRPAELKADCANPTDTAVMPAAVGGLASGSSFPHPLLERTAIMAGQFFRLVDFEMQIADYVDLGGSAEANPTIANLGTREAPEYAAFVARYAGIVTRVDIDAETRELTEGWSTPLPGECHFLIAAPVVHVHHYATPAFRAAYSNEDLVYVATANSCKGTPDTKGNRVYALNASTGAVEWTFNESGTLEMDWVSESPVLDIQNDMLIVASDRRVGPAQNSLWSIDVLTGTAAWSASVGRLVNAPVVRDDRIYVADYSGYIRALNREDGTVLWSNRASYYGFASNVFVEFRVPYLDLIAAADRYGNVVLVTDDGFSGSKVWDTPLSAWASGPVGIDPEHGKLYVGDVDGYLNQLSILDGSIEARREIDPGTSIGASTFTFSSNAFEEIVLVVGSSGGQFAKLCYPWATGALPAAVSGDVSSAAPDACESDEHCGVSPTVCAEWRCENRVCVPVPVPDADEKECTLGGTSGVCYRGVCSRRSTCDGKESLYKCDCIDDDGTSISRVLLVDEEKQLGGWEGDRVHTPVSEVTTTNSCLTIGSDARAAVFVHLIDQHGRPFKGADVTFTLNGNGATPPVWANPEVDKPLVSKAIEAERPGTYYAILEPPPLDGTPSSTEGIGISVTVNGPGCIDNHDPITTTITTAAPADQEGRGGCGLLGEGGHLEVTVLREREPVNGATVIVGHAVDETAFYSSYGRFIDTNEAGDRPNVGKTGETGQAGKVFFRDYGNKLNGPTIVRVEYEDYKIVVRDVDTSQLTIDLANPPVEQ